MENIINNGDEIIGRVEYVSAYLLKEISYQYNSDDIDKEMFYGNAQKIIKTLQELKKFKYGTLLKLTETPMGTFLVEDLDLDKNKEKNVVYVLREDLYNEWAWENGASNLICICDSIEKIKQKLKEQLIQELEDDDDRILEFDDMKIGDMQNVRAMATYAIDDLICGKDEIHILVYENKEEYENGKNNAEIIVSQIEIQ